MTKRLLMMVVFAACAWAAEEGHGTEPSLLWKWVNFAVVVLIIGYYAVKLGGPALRERAEGILDNLSAAAQRGEEAAARAAEIDRQMASLSAQVDTMRQEAREEMARDTERFKAETADLIAKVERNAEAEIAAAAKHVQNEVKALSAQLALELAQRKIAARMNPETQAALVDGFVRSLN